MSQDTEELDLDDGSVNDETNHEADDNNSSEDPVKQKNKSNWKELYKKAKTVDAVMSENARLKAELEDWENANPDFAETRKEDSRIAKMEEDVFLTRFPDAEAHADKIALMMRKHPTMERKEAWKFVQADLPKESKTKNDFSVGVRQKAGKPDYANIDADDALKLSKDEQKEWRKINLKM